MGEAPWLSVTHKRVQRSGLKVRQSIEGQAISWDCTRGQCTCVCASSAINQEKAARKGEVGKLKGRKRTVENTDVQLWSEEDRHEGPKRALPFCSLTSAHFKDMTLLRLPQQRLLDLPPNTRQQETHWRKHSGRTCRSSAAQSEDVAYFSPLWSANWYY